MEYKVSLSISDKENYDVEVAFVEGFDAQLVAASNNKISKKIAWIHTNMINNPHADVHYKNIEEQKKIYLKFDKVYAVSKDVKDKFIEKFGLENIEIQYNPVDSNEITAKSNQDCECVDKSGICMLTIGRLEEQKGYERLLRIANQLKKEKYQFKLYILGEGSLKETFMTYIKENDLDDYVYLLGFKSNPYSYLRQADFFVCSSYSEGFSTVATEALILGVPIITTRCSGMEELFGAFECGTICDNDEKALYGAIKKVLNNTGNLEYYKEEIDKRKQFFDIENRMKEIEALLDE